MNLAGYPFIKEERNKSWFYSKIINGLTPDYMYDMIQPYTENIHDYSLQQISGVVCQISDVVANVDLDC
jgi:hypothetical protein